MVKRNPKGAEDNSEDGVVEPTARHERSSYDDSPYPTDHYDQPHESGKTSKDTPTQWRHRRRMAYISLVGILTVTAFILSPWSELDRLSVVSEMVTWFYFAMASVVGAYMGFKSWATKK